MEGVLESQHRLPSRVVAGDLYGVLDRLGAGVEERAALLGVAGDHRVEPLGQFDVGLVVIDEEASVGHAVGLLFYGFDDPRVGVADVHRADAATEVYKSVAVNVGDRGALRLLGEDRSPGLYA